ncbi:MAG TPA: hypothetical protein VGM53_15140 [Streptosporangiaceae bacterium]
MNADEGKARRGASRPAPAGLLAAALAGGTLLVAGCGGGHQGADGASVLKPLRRLIEAAARMRTHGYPGWPDPILQNGQVNPGNPANVGTSSPQFQKAAKVCGPA